MMIIGALRRRGADGRRPDRRSPLRAAGYYAAGDLVERMLGLALLPVYARALDPSDFGILALVQSFTGLASAALGFGLYASIQRFLYNPVEGSSSRDVVGAVWGFLLVVPALALLMLATVARPALDELLGSLPLPLVTYTLLIAFLNIAFVEVYLAYARAEGRGRHYISITLGRAVLTSVLSVLFALRYDRGAAGVVEGQVIATAVVAAVACLALARSAKPGMPRGLQRELLRFGLPLVPTSVSSWSMRVADRFILDRTVTLADVGNYSLGYRLASGLQLVITAGTRSLQPAFSAAAVNDDRATARSLTAWFLIVTSSAGFTGMLLLEEFIDLLFPPEFAEAGDVGVIIFSAMIFMALFQVAAIALSMYSGKSKAVGPLTVAGAVANLGLNIVLIPHFGIFGAGLATLIAYVVLAGAMYARSPLPALLEGTGWRLLVLVTVAATSPYVIRPVMQFGSLGNVAFALLAGGLFLGAAIGLVPRRSAGGGHR